MATRPVIIVYERLEPRIIPMAPLAWTTRGAGRRAAASPRARAISVIRAAMSGMRVSIVYAFRCPAGEGADRTALSPVPRPVRERRS
jgi:hypothetical protein